MHHGVEGSVISSAEQTKEPGSAKVLILQKELFDYSSQ
jgi:hypothetical protein